jgi:non-ribosomal peptide synthase protein (TIGR01720 family)
VKGEVWYWESVVRQEVEKLPVDKPGDNLESGTKNVVLELGEDETEALVRQLPRVYKARISEILVTALAEAIGEWTKGNRVKIDIEGHGREEIAEEIDVTRTVGWFTTIYPFVVERSQDESIVDRLKRVKEGLRSIRNGGIGYGLLRYASDEKEISNRLKGTSRAEVCFNFMGNTPRRGSEPDSSESISSLMGTPRSPRAKRPYLIEINGVINGDRLKLDWIYCENIHLRSTIESLSKSFVDALRSLIIHSRSPEPTSLSPLDFKEFKWSHSDLDGIASAIQKARGKA